MEVMKSFFTKFIIKFLLLKLGRDKIPTSGKEALKNNDLFIHVYGFDERYPDKACTVLSMRKGVLECCRTELNNDEICKSIPVKELDKYDTKVLYFYKSWRITYEGIVEPFLHIVLGINILKRIFQRRYDKNLRFYNDRVGLLKMLVEKQQKSGSDELNYYDILTSIYGPRIHTSEENYRHYQNVRQILLSLKESEDLSLEDKIVHVEDIKILPKALKTLAEFELEQTRHRDSIKITRYQLWVAIMLAALTAANVYLTYVQIQHQGTDKQHNNSLQSTPKIGAPEF